MFFSPGAMFEKRAEQERAHFDLNTGSVLLGAVVTGRAEAHQQAALSRNRLQVLPATSRGVASGMWGVTPEAPV